MASLAQSSVNMELEIDMIDKYIITEEPFNGRVSVLLDGGTVAYTGGLTLAQWLEEEAHDYHKTVTPLEMEEIWNAWQEDSRALIDHVAV